MKAVSYFIVVILSAVGLIAPVGQSFAAPPSPLDRVPADAVVFAHLTAGSVWDHPAVSTLRKSYAKELEKLLKNVEKETGLRPEQIESLTFYYPKFPQGSGDEALFVLQVVTKKPYDRNTLLTGFRVKGETAKGDALKLREGMIALLNNDRQFTVLHQTLVEAFKNGPAKTDGVMTEAIRAAKAGKNTLVVGFDPTGLPPDFLANVPQELQPFLPLIKSKLIVFQANLGKDLSAEVRFVSENDEKAIEAERSFNLLMKLADDGITTILKDDKLSDDLKPLIPALMQVQKVVLGIKAQRQGSVTSAKASIKADPALAKPLLALFLQPQNAATRMRSQNNLKQIGVALHNYHDVNGVLPAAAIVDKKGKPLLSWRVAILPYVEQDNLYKKFHLDEAWDSPHNKPLSQTRVKVFELPYIESKPGITHYRAFVGNGAVFDQIQGVKFSQISDGTSNTLMVVEAADGVPWAKPDEIEFDPAKPMLKHLRFEKNVCNILMCDGSVRSVSNKLKEAVLTLLIQRDDGQPIPDFK